MADKSRKKRFMYFGIKKIVYSLLILVLILVMGASICSGTGFPDYFNWHDLNGTDWMTPVQYQGSSCGSCWAFSAIGIVEAAFNIYNNNPDIDLNLSEQQLLSTNSSCCSNCGNCLGGSTARTLEYIKNTGVVNETCFPYTASPATVCNLSACGEERYKIIDYIKVTPNTTESYKQAIMDYGRR